MVRYQTHKSRCQLSWLIAASSLTRSSSCSLTLATSLCSLRDRAAFLGCHRAAAKSGFENEDNIVCVLLATRGIPRAFNESKRGSAEEPSKASGHRLHLRQALATYCSEAANQERTFTEAALHKTRSLCLEDRLTEPLRLRVHQQPRHTIRFAENLPSGNQRPCGPGHSRKERSASSLTQRIVERTTQRPVLLVTAQLSGRYARSARTTGGRKSACTRTDSSPGPYYTPWSKKPSKHRSIVSLHHRFCEYPVSPPARERHELFFQHDVPIASPRRYDLPVIRRTYVS